VKFFLFIGGIMDKTVLKELNLNQKNEQQVLSESFLLMAGEIIKFIMKSMFGDYGAIPVKIRGTRQQVDAFTKTLAGEKKYMDAFHKYGLNNPKTYETKSFLDKAIDKFQKATGIRWPLNR
jgi:hypothetical protein